jgi:hypothetical protein
MNAIEASRPRSAESQGTQPLYGEAGEADLTRSALQAVFRAWRFAGADDVILNCVRHVASVNKP